jgi:antitoxin Phd
MVKIGVSEARARLPELIDKSHDETVLLERRGHLAAVIVSPERYEELLSAFEDREDVDAFDAALAEVGPNIPWERVKAELGW